MAQEVLSAYTRERAKTYPGIGDAILRRLEAEAKTASVIAIAETRGAVGPPSERLLMVRDGLICLYRWADPQVEADQPGGADHALVVTRYPRLEGVTVVETQSANEVGAGADWPPPASIILRHPSLPQSGLTLRFPELSPAAAWEARKALFTALQIESP